MSLVIWIVHWFSLGDCLWSSAKLLVFPRIPVPSYLYQPRLSSETFPFASSLPIYSLKFCSPPNRWSITFTCLEWPPAGTWPSSCFNLDFFFYGMMPMFIERGLPKRPTFVLIAAYRRNTGPSFKIKQLLKAPFYLFYFKNNYLCSTSRNNYMVLYIINWWHSTVKLCTTFLFFMLLEVVMRKKFFKNVCLAVFLIPFIKKLLSR